MLRSILPSSLILFGALWGCGSEPMDAPEVFTCDPAALPSASPMVRMSRLQVRNTVADLASRLASPEVDAAVAEALRGVPKDSEGDLRNVDQSVSQDHVDASYVVAEAFADAAVAHALPALLEGCGAEDVECRANFVERWGLLTHRRPLTSEETASLVALAGSGTPEQGIRDALLVMLAGPHFFYRIEHGKPEHDLQGAVPLTDFERAARLSYLFWQSMPDDALLQLAAEGRLSDPEVWRAQVDRVFADPRTQATLGAFTEQWLELDHLPRLDAQVGDPRWETFAAGFVPSDQLHHDMVADVQRLVNYQIFDAGADFDSLWTTAINTSPTAEVASLYGAEVWDGTSEPSELPGGVHVGLLTRPALQVTGTSLTSPIHEGVRIRRRVLCDSLGLPPADLGELPEIPEDATRREATAILTETEGSICITCHQQINPLGYVTEDFDALGRYRPIEPVIAEDGTVVAEREVFTTVRPELTLGEPYGARDAHDFAQMLTESKKPEACFARFWWRFASHRVEDLGADACSLETVRQSLDAGRPLAEALKALALTEAFAVRVIDDAEVP